MNRPFYAFGVLLAFLALAMLAIGLSSRPVGQPASARGGSGITSPRHGVGGVAHLLVVPDGLADDETPVWVAADYGDCDQPSYAQGCGLDRCTGQVYSVDSVCGPVVLQGATVELVAGPLPLEPANSLDCRAHYDPAYDALLYRNGPQSTPIMANDPAAEAVLRPLDTEAVQDQTLMLFHSLLGKRPHERAAVPRRIKSAQHHWRYEWRSLARGLGNQLWLSARRVGLDDEWQRMANLAGLAPAAERAIGMAPTWSDYEEWIASEQVGVAGRDTQAGPAPAFLSQPWRQVLQFAVSWLNHAAKTLGAVAERLGGPALADETDPIGLRSTGHRPR